RVLALRVGRASGGGWWRHQSCRQRRVSYFGWLRPPGLRRQLHPTSSATLSQRGRVCLPGSGLGAPRERPADEGEEEGAERHARRLADAELGAVDEAEERQDGAGQRVDRGPMEVTVDDEGGDGAQNHAGENRAATQQLHAAIDDARAAERGHADLLRAG